MFSSEICFDIIIPRLAKPFKTIWANLCFFSDRRLIVFQKSHAFRFLLFLLNKINAVENLFYILILAQRQSSEYRVLYLTKCYHLYRNWHQHNELM
jgi:hypothetical protein